MSGIDKTVFISYRRTNSMTARAVYQDLTQHGYDCFLDFNSIDSGSFERVILENIASRAHFILILTPSALERCNEPGDWLRREIEYALETERNIIPLMFEGFDFSSPGIAQYLTGGLSALASYNAQRVPADFFEEAMAKVRNRFLNVAVDTVLHPRTTAADDLAAQQQAVIAQQDAITEDQRTAEEWFERGLQSDDPQEQMRCYTEAIRLNPFYIYAYNNRGIIYYESGDLEAALQDYNYALRMEPTYAKAYYNRGNAHYDLNDLQAALSDYSQAVRFDPSDSASYHNRGWVYSELEQYDAAIRDYTRSIQLEPDYIRAYRNRGWAYRKLGNMDAALDDFNMAVQMDPHNLTTYYHRAYIYAETGQKQAALTDYRYYLAQGGGTQYGNQEEIEDRIRQLENGG